MASIPIMRPTGLKPEHKGKWHQTIPRVNSLLREFSESEVITPKTIPAKHPARRYAVSAATLADQLAILREIASPGYDKSVRDSDADASGIMSSALANLNKRKDDEASETCSFGEQCYRKHPEHFKSYRHPHRGLAVSEAQKKKNQAALDKERVVVMDRVKNSIVSKLEAASPYNLFLTTVTGSKMTHHEKLSLSFIELIDPMLGELESVLQLNFMVQLGWLLAQFHIVGLRRIPLTLLYGEIDMAIPEQLQSFITSRQIKCPSPFGSHHTKMMVFSYKDGSIRVVVSTANLVESDWDNRTQGVWVSPKCPPLPDGSDTLSGESPTRFKMCFIRYLSAYKVPELVPWIKKVSMADMSAIRVFFVGSVPGSHKGQALTQWGLGGLGSVLSDNLTVPEKNSYPLVLQCSSIGSMGPNPDSYLTGEVLRTFCSGKKEGVVGKPDVKLVYPSFKNIADSYDGLLGGGCLPYSSKTHDKQRWLTSYMCQWKSDKRHRSRAPPHIKSYCRVSPDNKKLSYFVLTSANLSKAAWGSFNKSGNLSILSYEAGVVFLPTYFFGADYFPLEQEAGDTTPVFPLPFDLPLTPFTYEDVPWLMDNIL
ncbi:unnamed protein product [Nesidiocoris tenuis]|uniref:PBZ-type domain-containing protein n=1 Tax=Nesidiocoris tenuis TaxID=355587 RepID=A0A6H5GNS3_9HEMI|nr:unnamed protein product [Nesidiocoris tenuis]